MKKFVLAAVAATTLFGASAQAAPVGVVRGLVGTGVAVLQAPGTTIATVITGRSVYTGNLAPLGLNFANAIVPILVGRNIPTTVETLTLPLPGPEFLNLNLVNVPGRALLNVKASGPVVVTFATGG